jgi:hypothetical protein
MFKFFFEEFCLKCVYGKDIFVILILRVFLTVKVHRFGLHAYSIGMLRLNLLLVLLALTCILHGLLQFQFMTIRIF